MVCGLVMPIFNIQEKSIHFAHVPKCGGTSISRYLEARFGPMAMLDRSFRKNPAQIWTRSSPQHVPHAVLDALLGKNAFHHRFAIVRHPATRFLSAYEHQATVAGISRTLSATKLLEMMKKWDENSHYKTDNHFLKAVDIVPENARVFRLEDGFEGLIAWLDSIEGQSRTDLSIRHENDKVKIKKKDKGWRRIIGGKVMRPSLDSKLAEVIAEFYAEDYVRFGYSTMPEGL